MASLAQSPPVVNVLSLTAWPKGGKYWAYVEIAGDVNEIEITREQYFKLRAGIDTELGK